MADNGGGSSSTLSRNSIKSSTNGKNGGYGLPNLDPGTMSKRRPESWNPQPVIYRTPTLVPSSWLNGKRDSNSRLMMTSGAPTFSRASQLYSTSIHTSEITFRKMT